MCLLSFIREEIDACLVLGETGQPAPVYLPAQHPVALRRAAVCLYAGYETIGNGATVPEAKNSAAKAMWLKLGHIITIDSRLVLNT
jgi:hypothetical protein